MPSVDHEHALLVGGSRGLGRVAAEAFAARGMAVSVIARGAAPDRRTAGIHSWEVDICDAPAVSNALRLITGKSGKLSRVVFFQRHRSSKPDWNGEMATSLTGTRNVIESLVTEHDLRDCAIVFVSSINAHLISVALPLEYHVAKAGLVQMARHYAVALGPRGIRLNSVSPGTFLKPESQDAILQNPARRRLHESASPLGRIGTAEEVFKVIDFLSGPDSSFVTGQDLIVDGGVSLRFQETLLEPASL